MAKTGRPSVWSALTPEQQALVRGYVRSHWTPRDLADQIGHWLRCEMSVSTMKRLRDRLIDEDLEAKFAPLPRPAKAKGSLPALTQWTPDELERWALVALSHAATTLVDVAGDTEVEDYNRVNAAHWLAEAAAQVHGIATAIRERDPAGPPRVTPEVCAAGD